LEVNNEQFKLIFRVTYAIARTIGKVPILRKLKLKISLWSTLLSYARIFITIEFVRPLNGRKEQDKIDTLFIRISCPNSFYYLY